MSFRFRKRVRLFPGVALNFSKNGLSSLSLGPRGTTVNVPLARDGGTRVRKVQAGSQAVAQETVTVRIGL